MVIILFQTFEGMELLFRSALADASWFSRFAFASFIFSFVDVIELPEPTIALQTRFCVGSSDPAQPRAHGIRSGCAGPVAQSHGSRDSRGPNEFGSRCVEGVMIFRCIYCAD